jgi:uncharacterized membrane protein YphA (DoxX/SURF4 family)
MEDSAAPPDGMLMHLELSRWKTTIGWISAILISILFLISGLWKITDIPGWAVRVSEFKIPASMSLAAAIGFGVAETFAGVLILVPRFRRWGAWLVALLLVGFMAYFAVNYSRFTGQECSCFPLVKRVVGPGFFIGDAVMLALAIVAGLWADRPNSLRGAALILGAVVVFALVSYGVEVTRQSGVEAPASITVDGKPFSTHQGRVFIFFFDPECMHCFDAAKAMSKMNWGETRVVAVPIQQKQFAAGFLQNTGFKAGVSNDVEPLKKVFSFVNVPAGVALVNGREKAPLTTFEGNEPEATLKKLGFIH